MVSVPVIIIVSILVFVILLILFFALTGHLHANPHIILIIILSGILLFSGYLILSYYKKWWPYRNSVISSDQTFNNVILYITLGITVVTSLILVWIVYLAFKHHKENKLGYLIRNENVESEKYLSDIEANPEIQEEQLVQQEEMSQGDVGLEKAEIERLALENQLQEEGANLEDRTKLEIAKRDKELERKNISEEVIEEGVKLAELKEIASTRALRSTLPSREMFGRGGSEDIINRLNTVPKQLEPEINKEMESINRRKLSISKRSNKPKENREEQEQQEEEQEQQEEEQQEQQEEEENIKGFESEGNEGLFNKIGSLGREVEPEIEEGAEMTASLGTEVEPEIEEGAEMVA